MARGERAQAHGGMSLFIPICMCVCYKCLYSKHARACLLRISVRLAVVYYALKCRYITAYITAYIMPQSVWISDHYILCLKVSVQSRREGTDYVLALFFFFTHYFFFSCQAVRLRSALLIILSWNLFIVLLTDWLIDWFFKKKIKKKLSGGSPARRALRCRRHLYLPRGV